MATIDGECAQERSLDRLKHLDSLPDIKDQLRTAGALCTTAERASMILRWLLEKMEIDQNCLASAETWTLFTSTLRLVPPQRAAVHLGSHDIVDLFWKAALECQCHNSAQILSQIDEAIRVMLAISHSVQGAHLRAVLRSSSDKAAAFVGAWLEACVSSAASLNPSPALEIWGLRKPGLNDDEAFSTRCLLWAAKLLFRSSADFSNLTKRRKDSKIPTTDGLVDIRRLLAKHVLLPSRTSFFAEQGTDQFRIKLQAFRDSPADLQILPQLLDVAANLTPVITPKQRRDESRWVEAVFRSITTLISSSCPAEEQANLVCKLLDVVLACNYSLSRDVLSDVVTDFTVLLESDPCEIQWDIIALLVRLDPSLFLEEPFASAMFEKLPASLTGREALAPQIHDVATPVLQCFATYHRLEDYFSHLESQAKRHPLTPWTRLSFDSVRDELPADLIVARIDRYAAWLKPTSPVHEIRAGIALLCNLMNTRFDDEIWTQVYQQCGVVLTLCLDLVKSKSKAVEMQLWHLAKAAFELWFPLWTAGQTDNLSKLTEMGTSILGMKKLWKASEIDEDALAFLITVCLAFRPYPDCTQFYEDVIQKLENTERLNIVSKSIPAFVLGSKSTTHTLDINHETSWLEVLAGTSAEDSTQIVSRLIAQLQNGSERQKQTASYVIARLPPSLIGKEQKNMIARCEEEQQGPTHQKAWASRSEDHLKAQEALQQAPAPIERQAILQAFRSHFDHFDKGEKMWAIEQLSSLASAQPSSALPLLLETLSTFDVRSVEELDPERKRYDLFVRILGLADTMSGFTQYRHATDCVLSLLQNARFMVNQHGVEATVAAYCNNLKRAHSSTIHFVILDACKVFTTLLQKHEHRLQGRFHLVTPFLQELLTALLRPLSIVMDVSDRAISELKVQQATAVAQSVKFFCNPRQRKQSKVIATGLSDEAGKAKAHVGEFVRYVLHHYCTEVLKHPPNEEIRKALTPGLWAMIEAISTSGDNGMESLSAAMNNNQRGILRSVYDEWKTFGRWKPGANNE
ncbi:hypothetical protein K431DRAFT_284352 [Polychaeton citri CBS 116435]|uniref:Nucleolar 27S pre-rRNA processing Urb2/Npa2 C-terminal domain-containing protein n=1 Tax=Polychaeton citri CBS 116435 TaxID=1314669 RepID=A0A9P4UN24_9PEZI|nr:hypothetical protein K431DRAFT_284352 [Polychaeton citri CBS 116435]